MNERIRLLAEQASTFAYTEYPKQTMATFNTNKSVEQLFNQKFAQLIVAECATLLPAEQSHAPNGQPILKIFQEHFGVEL